MTLVALICRPVRSSVALAATCWLLAGCTTPQNNTASGSGPQIGGEVSAGYIRHF